MYETDAEIRAKAIELAIQTQIQIIDVCLNNPNVSNITFKDSAFCIADKIFWYIRNGEKHPEGLVFK